MAQPRIAIIGGGISGLVLAMALHEKGIKSEIYEQAAHFGEIGAGVAFSANAIRAMNYCSPEVVEAFQAVATGNKALHDDQGRLKWFDFVNGYDDDPKQPEGEEYWFHLTTTARGGTHRAHFLDELVKHAPKDLAHFDKRLDTIAEQEDGSYKMKFSDGSTADADTIIGCDGIKSRVRQIMFGQDNPCSHPVYTHRKAYRGLLPMDRARTLLGDFKAENGTMHLGYGGHILTFPVAKGEILNVVCFAYDENTWPSDTKLTLPSTKEQALEDFKRFGKTSRSIIEMLEPDLDCWGIFDTALHPCPTYNQGRICLLGDAAHATSPHHGAGAGMCVEDSAVMAAILAEAKTNGDYAKAFECFTAQRKERTQWLVQSSRITGTTYDWMNPDCGSDKQKIYDELDWRTQKIWHYDTDAMIQRAITDIRQRIGATNG